MIFCSICATKLIFKIPEGDNQTRGCCPNCKTIHYQNPKIVVGTIPIYKNQVLLCKRAIEPRYGFWTLPAGFMELKETTHEGALRETREEAGAHVELGPLFSMFDVIHAEQVHLFFLAHLPQPIFEAGPESLAVQLFNEEDIPWEDLSFSTVKKTLELFFKDRAKQHYGFHSGDIREPISWPINPNFAKR